jgi:Leucine-rich repeat (LRR) protein
LNVSQKLSVQSSHVWVLLATPDLSTKLKTLDISDNALKSLPPEVHNLVNLKSLFASGCKIQSTNDLRGLNSLKRLKLDSNELEIDTLGSIPETVTALHLSCNRFTAIAPALHSLVHLTVLDLCCNRIESLEGVEFLVALVELNLEDNLLVEVPDSVGALMRLQKLVLAKNKFQKESVTRPHEQSIPAGVLRLPALTNIDLSGNTGLSKADVLQFEGCGSYIERRRVLCEKQFAGGAIMDGTLFGLS